MDEDQHGGDGEPCGRAEAGRGDGEARLESCTQQGQPQADVEIEEAAEQRGVAGKEGKARLPPVRAAEDDAVEGDGAERGQHEGEQDEAGAESGGRDDAADHRADIVDADVGVGRAPGHRVHLRKGRRVGAAGDEP